MKTTTGLSRESEGALTYILPVIGGIIFLVLERDKYVRFHAMQSIVFWVTVMALWMILGFTIILILFTPILFIISFVLWLVLVYKAWLGEEWEVPVLGKLARKLLAKA